MGFKPGDYPHSERAAKETLALPIYPELSEDMISRIVGTIVEFFKSHGN
jgi:dTDP-4-amino-4,6-dideoxygalactose transaminase